MDMPLQWFNVTGDGQWSHLDTDFNANKITWENNKFNPKWYGKTWDHVYVRNSENIDDVSDIAGQYNSYAKSHAMTPKMYETETICSYEIINLPIFKPGENSTVKLNITNPANVSMTVIVVVELLPSQIQPGGSPIAVAGDYKQLIIPANSEITEDFDFAVPGDAFPSDDYKLEVYEVVGDNGTLVLTQPTQILAKHTLTIEMPDDITYKQPFAFNVTIRNIVAAPIHNISVELDTHYYFNTTEPLEKEILVLDAGENYTFTWSLTPIDYGDLRVDVIVYTSDAGSETRIVDVSVLSTPKLWINAQVPEKVNKSDDFILNATVFNSGDISSDSVTLNLTTPENITANRTSAELGIIEAHENKTCSVRISQNESRDFMIILNATALNVTATGYAFITISQVPIAYFTYEPQNPVVNQLITFNASNSTDPDGTITNYEWDFGDGNVTNTTEAIINHSYASAGDYTANLTVTDNDGATNTTSKLITVTNLCGDVAPSPDCDGTVDMGDVILLLNNVSYPENPRYVLCNDWSGDCRCTGIRDMAM